MNPHATVAALENQAFALMGRLHVILRRQSGRVTDIEYMRIDPVYCRYLLKLASEMPHEDLQEICSKLEDVYFGPEGLFVRAPPKIPLLAKFSAAGAGTTPPSLPEAATAVPAAPTSGTHLSADDVDRSYVGRLR